MRCVCVEMLSALSHPDFFSSIPRASLMALVPETSSAKVKRQAVPFFNPLSLWTLRTLTPESPFKQNFPPALVPKYF